MQHSLADFIAQHVLIVLAGIIILSLVLAAIFWRLVERHASHSWLLAIRAWTAFRATALAARIRKLPILGQVLSGTVTAFRYLGAVAVLGFLIAIGATIAFVELADEIGAEESIAAFDAALAAALREHASHDMLQAFAFVTHLGDQNVLIVLSVCTFVYLLHRSRWLLSAAWLIATASGALLNVLLKQIFERSRPIHDHGLLTETSWSFPSGHASGSTLIYGLLAYLLVRHAKAAFHIPIALVSITLIIFVGSSRVILQVHYLSDVLAGYISAAAWVAICIAALEAIRWGERSRASLTLASAPADKQP